MNLLKLSLLALFPLVISALVYEVEKKTRLKNLNYMTKQLIYGLIFGGLAILGTEFGVHVNDAILNTRDASALIAGLIFGAPSGIIAGCIGGVERFLAPLWGVGIPTRYACSISTVLAGIIGAVFRKYVFNNKKPTITYALGIGLVTEVQHMLMIFITMPNSKEAFSFVSVCAIPMITINGLAVMFSVLIITILDKDFIFSSLKSKKISDIFQKKLFICVIVAFFVTCGFTVAVQTQISNTEQDNLLTSNIKDIGDDINYISENNLIDVTYDALAKIIDDFTFDEIICENRIYEINIIDNYGIIRYSSNPENIGFNMVAEPGQAKDFFNEFVKGKKRVIQPFQAISRDSSIYRKYSGILLPAGVLLDEGGILQVGYNEDQFYESLESVIKGLTKYRLVGQEGYIVIADRNKIVVSDRHDSEGKLLKDIGLDLDFENIERKQKTSIMINDEPVYVMYDVVEEHYIITVYPKAEATFQRDLAIYISVFMEIIVFMILFVLVYFLIKKLVVNNIIDVNVGLSKITKGDLDVIVDVRDNEEFSLLSDDINSTVNTLKNYISEAAARIDKELEFAKTIQYSTLPSEFPKRNDFDIYALMDTAKEVGGDFYDFYFVDNNRLAFLIADVSGKGIPAAMFMMTAKTMIKSYAESLKDPAEALTFANKRLCENNEANMFVTAWLGMIDLETNVVEFANAGHNPPLVKHVDGNYEYLRTIPGFVLGGLKTVKYKKQTMKLNKGESIFIYTDGVTEAMNFNEELYGEDRLYSVLNSLNESYSKDICKKIKEDVDKFVGDADQFDDITMLSLRMKGYNMDELTINATIENISIVTDFVNNYLDKFDCSMKVKMQLDIAIDELLSNIAHYAYNPDEGPVTVKVEVFENPLSVEITFIDKGVPYDPLAKNDPDITSSAQDRKIGGLGIFMVKKTMDDIIYDYKDGKNILKIKKGLK